MTDPLTPQELAIRRLLLQHPVPEGLLRSIPVAPAVGVRPVARWRRHGVWALGGAAALALAASLAAGVALRTSRAQDSRPSAQGPMAPATPPGGRTTPRATGAVRCDLPVQVTTGSEVQYGFIDAQGGAFLPAPAATGDAQHQTGATTYVTSSGAWMPTEQRFVLQSGGFTYQAGMTVHAVRGGQDTAVTTLQPLDNLRGAVGDLILVEHGMGSAGELRFYSSAGRLVATQSAGPVLSPWYQVGGGGAWATGVTTGPTPMDLTVLRVTPTTVPVILYSVLRSAGGGVKASHIAGFLGADAALWVEHHDGSEELVRIRPDGSNSVLWSSATPALHIGTVVPGPQGAIVFTTADQTSTGSLLPIDVGVIDHGTVTTVSPTGRVSIAGTDCIANTAPGGATSAPAAGASAGTSGAPATASAASSRVPSPSASASASESAPPSTPSRIPMPSPTSCGTSVNGRCVIGHP